MRIRDSRPLLTRHADAIADALTAPFGPEFDAAVRRAHALERACGRRRATLATLAAWDQAVAAWRSGEGYATACNHLPARIATPAMVAIGGRA